jgi:hypothetical protein
MSDLLSEMFSGFDVSKINKILTVNTSPYWHSHYVFDKEVDTIKTKKIGNEARNNLIINAIVPFVFLYGKFQDKIHIQESALDMLELIPAEKNHIVERWGNIGIPAKSSAESQALIELYNSYCSKKRCLSCSIGASLMLDIIPK